MSINRGKIKIKIKIWYICSVEYYSAIDDELMSFAATEMDLEIFKLSEVSQTKRPVL